MYHIYTTPSIVLSREPSGDSAFFRLLTRDFGLVVARAQGIRRDTSRLKGVLQEFSLATVAYVRTKAGWKITTAIGEKNYFTSIGCGADTRDRKVVMARITECLVRFIVGEESNIVLFDTVQAGLEALAQQDKDLFGIEILTLVRVLALLGYVAQDEYVQPLIGNPTDFCSEQIAGALLEKKKIVAAINKAFVESHL